MVEVVRAILLWDGSIQISISHGSALYAFTGTNSTHQGAEEDI